MPDAPETTQTPAESAQPAATSTPEQQPAAPSTERKGLASFADALRQSSARSAQQAARTEGDKATGTTDSGTAGDSTETVSTSRPAARASAADPDATAPPIEDSADEASTPEQDGKGDEQKANGGQGTSRRERAAIRDLTTERDTLKGEVEQLRASLTIPDHIQQAAIGSRLTDDEFQQLRTRRERANLTGDYLSADESEKLDTAIQVRDWSQAWYADAYQQASTWANGQQQAIQREQAEQLAPVLKGRPYITHEPIVSAPSYQHVYEHIADASLAEGRRMERSEAAPKLEAAEGRIHDLEAELSGLRHGNGGQVRTFERGGQSSGAFGGNPDFRTSSSHALFAAAEERASRERSRRTKKSA